MVVGLSSHGGERKKAIRTCPYSPVSEWSPPAGRPRGRALTELAQLVVRVLPTSIRSLWSWVRALMEAKEKGNRDLYKYMYLISI